MHSWTLAIFQAGAASVVFLWAVDAWRSHTLRFSRSPLQLPLIGLIGIGLIQLLPLGGQSSGGALPVEPVRSLSLDPYVTRLVLVQISALLIYFAAALAFIDSPRRLRVVVRTIIVFSFLLAIFGLIQFYTSPGMIYWLKDSKQSQPFGPFINRHHFAGYMELALALPLGLLFSGAIDRDRRILYAFFAFLMAVALFMTNSRGGIISFLAETAFLAVLWIIGHRSDAAVEDDEARRARLRGIVARAAISVALLLVVIFGVLSFGGENVLDRFFGTVNAQDPTTGRAHFWGVALNVIADHPVIGAGLGSFGLAYTRYDTRSGMFRVEQVHNDYLQVLTDAGVVGAVLGIFFIIMLFRTGLARRESKDKFRSGVASGALAGCFAVLVHSFFDFTLHTTSNALLFLVLAALATINGRVEEEKRVVRRRRRRHHQPTPLQPITGHQDQPAGSQPQVKLGS